MITKSDASTGGKLHSVIHHIGYHLCQPVLLNVYKTIRHFRQISDDNRIIFLAEPGGFFQLLKQGIQIYIRIDKLKCSGLNLGKIQNISYELQQQGIIVLDNIDVFFFFFRLFRIRQNTGKTDNGIERGTYFVAHISQES